ncbi:MAG TPA: nitrile hydratase accessory protein [Dactylosporangium sp.]|nr:nitrile hydratase accessory protein [Dactylosporangium sp.]
MTAPLDVEGPAAPPRSNGELLFAEPWESRAFGMAVALHEAGVFGWSQFRDALVARIAMGEATYYQHWLGAVEDVLAARGTVAAGEVTARVHLLADRPAGHDHPH